MRPLLCAILVLFTATTKAQQWNWAADAGGGGNVDFCFGIATDSQSNAYWVGSVSGTADFGCGTLSPGNTIAGFVAKVDANGICQWVRGITVGFNEAWAYGIAIDAQDRIYVTGSYDGNADFGNGVLLNSIGSDDIFLARYDVDGTCLWARRGGSSGSSDEARGVAVSDSGDVFITGISGGSTITFDNISIPNAASYRQVIIARYDSTGTVQWAKASTGSGQGKSSRAITVANDRLYITGQIDSAGASFDGLEISPTASTKLYVLACDLDGGALWANAYGVGDHEGMGIAADTLGNVFVVGRMWGSLYLPDDTLTSNGSNDDILLMALDQDGEYRWAKSTGSTQRDLAWGVTIDGLGNAYVAAQFNSTIDFFGAPFTALGSEDILISKIEADGDVVWAQRPSGVQRDIPLCIHRQAAAPHKLYFGGYFWGAITYGSTTIDDVLNGDAMMVSGIDTTFDVSSIATDVCPGACDGTIEPFVIAGTAPFTFQWNNGSTMPELDGLCPGIYIVEVIDANGQVIIDTVYINEVADPGFTIQASGSTLTINGGIAYEWYFNDAVILDSDNASIEADANGDYHALVTTAEGCVFSSDTLAYIGMGLRDPSGGDGMSLYPSPATDHITLLAARPITRLWVVSTLGEIMPMRYDGTSKIDVGTLAPGLYFLRALLTDGSTIGETFVKD